MNFTNAKKLAETWVLLNCAGVAEIVEDSTLKKPYGWVFFYRGKDQLLAGNAPIIVDRIKGELRVTGTARPIDEYLAEFEASIPPVWLTMTLPSEP